MRNSALILLALATVQCGGRTSTRPEGDCVVGQGYECSCPGGAPGTLTCDHDGGYGQCQCGGGPATGGGTSGTGGSTGGTAGSAGTGGSSGAGPRDAMSDFVCTSGRRWTGGTTGSALMTPGHPCQQCHANTRAPQYTAAGTIFMGLHDSDDCNGVDGLGVAVAILDLNGVESGFRLLVNSVGNFVSIQPLPPMFRAKVLAGGREIVKLNPVTNGDCNTCHTREGANGARGRLVRP